MGKSIWWNWKREKRLAGDEWVNRLEMTRTVHRNRVDAWLLCDLLLNIPRWRAALSPAAEPLSGVVCRLNRVPVAIRARDERCLRTFSATRRLFLTRVRGGPQRDQLPPK